jgi:hypothetical protein
VRPNDLVWNPATLAQDGAVASLRVNGAQTSLIKAKHEVLFSSLAPEFARTFAWTYWTEPDLASVVPAVPMQTDVPIFKGYFWTWVRNWSPGGYNLPTDPVRDEETARLRQSLNTVVAVNVRERAPQNGGIVYCNTKNHEAIRFAPEPLANAGDILRGDVILDIGPEGQETWTARIGAASPRSGKDRISPSLAEAMLNPALRFVMASDRVQASKFKLSGAVINAAGEIVSTLVQDGGELLSGIDVPPVLAAQARVTMPSPSAPLVAAVSARRAEMLFFSRSGTGQNSKLQIRAVQLVSRTEVTELIDIRVTDPVAATYRAQDDAYYILDAGRRMRLLRVLPNRQAEVIADWDRDDDRGRSPERSSFALTTSVTGELTLTVSSDRQGGCNRQRTTSPEYCAAVLSPNAQGTFASARIFKGSGTAFLAAHLGVDAVLTLATQSRVGERSFVTQQLSQGRLTTLRGAEKCF